MLILQTNMWNCENDSKDALCIKIAKKKIWKKICQKLLVKTKSDFKILSDLILKLLLLLFNCYCGEKAYEF